MKKILGLFLLLPALLGAQQARQMARSTTAFGDSSIVITSDTLTNKTTFVTKAVSLAQIRKSLSKFAFDSLVSTKLSISGGTITGAHTVSGVATFSAQPIMSGLTASLPVFTDGSKGLVSNTMTGSGNVVMSASPTLSGTITAAAANFSASVNLAQNAANTLVIGTASTGNSTVTSLLLQAGSGTASGPFVEFRKNASNVAYLGAESSINSGTSSDFDVYAANNLRLSAGGTLVATASTAGLALNTLALSGVTTLGTSAAVTIDAGTTRVANFNGGADTEINLYAPTGAGGADHRRWGIHNNGTTFNVRRINDAYNSATIYLTVSEASTTVNGHFLAGTDATWDIGASGATRFRDAFLSRSIIASGGEVSSAGPVQTNSASKAVVDFNTWARVTGFGSSTVTDGAVSLETARSNGSSRTLLFHGAPAGDTILVKLFATALSSEPGTKSALCIDPVTFEIESNAAATCTVSSRRYKHDIASLSLADASKITFGLVPSTFTYNAGGTKAIGLIAEDAAKVDPRLAVSDTKGQINSVNYEQVTVALLRVVQDQAAQIKALEVRITKLEKH